MQYPRYIRGESLPDKDGKTQPEWVVRLYDNNIEDAEGNKVPTPDHLLNRYYKTSGFIPKDISMFQGRIFLRYEDINKKSIEVK